MQKSILPLLVLAAAWLSVGHEFWIEPANFFAQPNQAVRLGVCVGENFTCEAWDAGISRVTRLNSFLGKKKTDWLGMLEKQGLGGLELRFKKNGTHLITLATNNKFLELEAEKFDEYLLGEGLEHVVTLRKKAGHDTRPGREHYRREASALVQIGDKKSNLHFQQTGFDLKILPQRNPYELGVGDVLRYQITWMGKPLSKALVLHWVKPADGEKGEKASAMLTDQGGWVEFKLRKGDNMVSLVHMVPSTDPAAADWQSIWGSLTFGVK